MKTSSNSNTYPLVSADWLNDHLNDPEIIVFDASMDKVTSDTNASEELQIPNAQLFDIKNVFSDTSAPFPSTVPSEELFTKGAQKLGVNSDSRIVVYDEKGIYSSARVWYLFRAFGFNNIAVLDGGLPEWKNAGYTTEPMKLYDGKSGNFIGHYDSEKFKFFSDIQKSLKNKHHLIIDARSENRFKSIEPEPRKGLRSGSIPNSVNIPFSNLLVNGQCFKSKEEIQKEFDAIHTNDEHLVFSCGSGITACVLALGAELIRKADVSVYDGSWTEYGSLTTE